MGRGWRRARLGGALAAVTLLGVACLGDDSEPARKAPAPERSLEPTTTAPNNTPTPTPTPTPSPTPPFLLPNLQSLPAEDVHIDVTDEGRDLRFTSVIANVGDGPLVLRPDDEPECPEDQRHASQLVSIDADGDDAYDQETDTETEVNPAGCMLFHPTHEHWHFDASASYVLSRPGEDTPVVSADKVSFCMRDSRRLPGERWANVPERYGECEQQDQIQGISTGWGDVYDSELDGQALPLPDDLDDGTYCLRLSTDPFGLLRETNEDDNGSVVAVQITGNEATRDRGNDACAT